MGRHAIACALAAAAGFGCSFEGRGNGDLTPDVDAAPAIDSAPIDSPMASPDAASLPACFSSFNDLQFGNNKYRVLTTPMTFADAVNECQTDGGRLAVIENANESTALANYLDSRNIFAFGCLDTCAWIGLSQPAGVTDPNSDWTWIDGTDNDPLDATRYGWSADEPNDFFGPGSEQCASILGQDWIDLGCGGTQPAICECNSN